MADTFEIFANEATTTLSATTTSSATSLTVTSSTGFPTPASGSYFMARLEPAVADGTHEYVKVTAVSGATWTVARAQEGSTGTAWASGARVTAVLTAGSVARLLQKLNMDVTISDPTNQKHASFHINDDGSATTGWLNRLEFLFTAAGSTEHLTSFFNEYGELRIVPGKTTTVPARIYQKDAPGSAAHTANLLEFMDDRTTRTLLAYIDNACNLHVPNLPNKISVSSTAPSSPADGDLWVDLSS